MVQSGVYGINDKRILLSLFLTFFFRFGVIKSILLLRLYEEVAFMLVFVPFGLSAKHRSRFQKLLNKMTKITDMSRDHAIFLCVFC